MSCDCGDLPGLHYALSTDGYNLVEWSPGKRSSLALSASAVKSSLRAGFLFPPSFPHFLFCTVLYLPPSDMTELDSSSHVHAATFNNPFHRDMCAKDDVTRDALREQSGQLLWHHKSSFFHSIRYDTDIVFIERSFGESVVAYKQDVAAEDLDLVEVVEVSVVMVCMEHLIEDSMRY